MKRLIGIILSLLLLNIINFGSNYSDYVNLFIATAGDHGQLDPAATVPFGLVKLGPDTQPGNHGGYDFNSTKIQGFSHNRFGGVGCSGAGGNLRILPNIGLSNIAEIDKNSEQAKPAFYKIRLKNGILAELTATNNTGFHRYTFPQSDAATIVFDSQSSFAGTLESKIIPVNKNEFFVEVSSKNVCGFGRYTGFYHVWINKPLENYRISDKKLIAEFKTENAEQILLKVTASAISKEDARFLWRQNARIQDFETVKKSGLTEWEKWLSKIELEGNEEYKILFYTFLYRTLLNPVRDGNPAGEFRATDGKLYKANRYQHYAGWSMWDNFRNKFSLIALISTKTSTDIANSLIDLYKYGKPVWSGFNESVPNVRTEHSLITLLDLKKRGISGFNLAEAYGNMAMELANSKAPTPDSVLELSYDYWALSQIADILNKKSDAELFRQRAFNYKKVWKEKFLPITEKSDVMHGDGLYEGTLWQYRWHVQFDIDGMLEMLGGKEKCVEQLEYFFDNNLYNHGNQPDLHVPFMFNLCGKPGLTQKWTTKILTGEMIQQYGTHEKWKTPYIGRIYKNDPKGFIPEMDDDDGTMSAWFVLSSMGIYPVLVGDPVFQITTPIFDKITIHLENGKKFVIKTNRKSQNDFYISKAKLNGQEFKLSEIEHKILASGGILEFHLSNQPAQIR